MAASPWQRWSYAASIDSFLGADEQAILGHLVGGSDFPVEEMQRNAWLEQIGLLKETLVTSGSRGAVYLEYSIPRLGKRIDTVLILDHVLFVLEFKVGEQAFTSAGLNQVWDYALDLKNFHEPSHGLPVVPLLIATRAPTPTLTKASTDHSDRLLQPLRANAASLRHALQFGLDYFAGSAIDWMKWQTGRYMPTPTIVEAATALYAGHAVESISRSDAGAQNLALTAQRLSQVIEDARQYGRKVICLVTGVPGAGKTLVGLDIANRHTKEDDALYSVFLSGNGPLVRVLVEALAHDEVARAKEQGRSKRIGEARSAVKQFIQAIHHFRDEGLHDEKPPVEHVALFDEAQRAWNREKTADFMRRKRRIPDFAASEPEFLISCMDRHDDWAVVVCLVGSGQEINTGEAGIGAWLDAVNNRFPHWQVHLSPKLTEIEFRATEQLARLGESSRVTNDHALHLATSVRSFRSDRVSTFINQLLALELEPARQSLREVLPHFPIRLTRSLPAAKQWLRSQARGNERYGMIVSSQAQRLKPYAIDVRATIDPVHWFLHDKTDVRSSYYLEDVATEFQVQGLELDWACVVWDGDLRVRTNAWDYFGFKGKRWQRILKEDRQRYLLNAYRVLLTRARQGMVVVVPEGDADDPTRNPHYYDPAFELLVAAGIPRL
ncbi:DUF2075 domain-containing protein [Dokdonella immobilis]|uniref:DUF2075 family protein n=1 Tax=Dokdonella immobilis TaxID=578942 RepID=A0A1I5A7U2_9GAMM|nr:DUF2075 domain-containing protein [Dokdonella immobilis]SFN58438.1 DUF2075 family protein [Dokdonella immobilis]